jgi:hypothetical protein
LGSAASDAAAAVAFRNSLREIFIACLVQDGALCETSSRIDRDGLRAPRKLRERIDACRGICVANDCGFARVIRVAGTPAIDEAGSKLDCSH